MQKFILLTVLQMLSLNEAYNFTCPSPAHWNIRAKSRCNPPRNYTCLFDVTFRVNVYRDKCNRPSILGPGYKYVFQPNLNRATCSVNRYQPFIFETNGYSDCTFQKSLCNSQGQKTYENGDTTIDSKCICNTYKGYTFVIRNLKNQCYCNPSTEDCSCYFGINPYNTQNGREGIKCYDDMKMSGSLNTENMFNTSRTIKIIEFDNYKYNLKFHPTNKYRMEAAKCVFILSLACIVVWIIVLSVMRLWSQDLCTPRNLSITKYIDVQDDRSFNFETITKQTLTKPVLPEAIHHLSEEDKIRYKKLMSSSQNEKRYFVRIMIVGKQSAGKTSLMRRLLNEDISDVSSTDGVDIVVSRCKINIEDGKWTIGEEIVDDKVGRIQRASIRNEKTNTDVTEKIESNASDKSINVQDVYPIIDGSDYKDTKNTEVDTATKDRNLRHDCYLSADKIEATTDTTINLETQEDKKESSSLVMPDDLISHVFSKSTANTSSNLYALCELWDFAGQKEFYATHQAFLTSTAIYLVVADMNDDISRQGLSQSSADYQDIGGYVDFWFDTIHCHRTDVQDMYGHLDPPVLLVFTGKDKFNKVDFEEREKECNKQLDTVLGLHDKYNHYRDKFYLSNKAVVDTEFEKLRHAIFNIASKMDNWGKSFPLTWILLEHLIEINKNNGKNFVNLTDMFNLAKHKEINILEKNELLLFLRCQHNEGNIIFFENIPDLIILNPQWLADAFRCLVSDRFNDSRLHHLKDWTLFKRHGNISELLIAELFKSKDGRQFSEQTDNLRAVMEKLDILVKIENSNYIIPSMMPSSTFKDVCETFDITKNFKRTSWLCFKFEFLPPSFFNHLSAMFIRNYNPSKIDGGLALYRGICMFDTDRSGGTKILITMSTDTIALQVMTLTEQQEGVGNKCSDICSKVIQRIEDIKEKYEIKISFEIHFKCSDGHYFQDTFEYEKLKSENEYFCSQHKQMHRSEPIYSTWMDNEVKRSPARADINTKQEGQNQKNKPKVDAHDQISAKTNLPVLVTLQQQLNIKRSKNENLCIYSCIKTGNTLVFTDIKTGLIFCNSDGTDTHYIPLSCIPYYITVIESISVAVSCIFDKTILIINLSTRSVTSTINTNGDCESISYNDNNLYVVIDRSIIHVMDLTGKVLRTIPLPSGKYIYDITVDRDRLVCINATSIYCCSLDGTIFWKFKKNKFQDFRRVTTDGEGNVYVTKCYNDTVVVVSDDGKHHKEIFTKSDGLNKPWGIYFDKQGNSLLVCNHNDEKAFLVDVIKN